MWSAALWFLVAAIWGLFILIVAIFNPKNLAVRCQDLGKRTSLGPLRSSFYLFTDDGTLYRTSLWAWVERSPSHSALLSSHT
jgi:hypothetical protein